MSTESNSTLLEETANSVLIAKAERLVWTFAVSGITVTPEQAKQAIEYAKQHPLPEDYFDG